jgi:hypothetical protein
MDKGLFDSLGEVAGEPLAFVAYMGLILLFAWRAWLKSKPIKEAEKIITTFKNDSDKKDALRQLMGTSIPDKIKNKDVMQWVKIKSGEKTKKLLVFCYASTLITFIVISALVYENYQESKPRLEMRDITDE